MSLIPSSADKREYKLLSPLIICDSVICGKISSDISNKYSYYHQKLSYYVELNSLAEIELTDTKTRQTLSSI